MFPLKEIAPAAALVTQTKHWLITLAAGAVIETGGLREVTCETKREHRIGNTHQQS